jgi:polysaccharide deacetylase family protein (PEP-CTERM system associated)
MNSAGPVPTVAIANAMTVDVEDWFQVAAFFGQIQRDSWATLEYRVEANTDRVLQIFSDAGVSGTFFVLGWVAQRSPGLVRRIHALGHEIACHGMSHEFVYRQTPEQFRAETRQSKRLLEQTIGQPVRGYRASTYSITRKAMWALDILLDEGFEYDSSIFPVRHPQYGIPGASRELGIVLTPKSQRIVEFPLTTARFGPIELPVAGGGYFRILPYRLTAAGLRSINRREHRPFIFYFHPWEIDPGQPRVADASWSSRFRHYTNLDRCEARLQKLLADFSFTTVRAVLERRGLLSTARPV